MLELNQVSPRQLYFAKSFRILTQVLNAQVRPLPGVRRRVGVPALQDGARQAPVRRLPQQRHQEE